MGNHLRLNRIGQQIFLVNIQKVTSVYYRAIVCGFLVGFSFLYFMFLLPSFLYVYI